MEKFSATRNSWTTSSRAFVAYTCVARDAVDYTPQHLTSISPTPASPQDTESLMSYADNVSRVPGSSYQTPGKWQTAVIFITNEVGIGILSLPAAMQTLGLIPGIIAIIGLGLVTTYTAYVLVQFYRRYPTVMNIVDCCQIIGGKPLARITAIAFTLNLALTCASACLTMSIALNSMSGE